MYAARNIIAGTIFVERVANTAQFLRKNKSQFSAKLAQECGFRFSHVFVGALTSIRVKRVMHIQDV